MKQKCDKKNKSCSASKAKTAGKFHFGLRALDFVVIALLQVAFRQSVVKPQMLSHNQFRSPHQRNLDSSADFQVKKKKPVGTASPEEPYAF